MRKQFVMLLLLICFSYTTYLYGQDFLQTLDGVETNLSIRKNQPDTAVYSYPKLHLSVSNFAGGNVGLGITKQTSQRCREHVLNAYKCVGVFGGISGESSGLYYQMNLFKRPKPTGIFFITQLGAMQYKGKTVILTPDGSDNPKKQGYAPIAAIGIGISGIMRNTSCIRASLDGGCKMSPINFNITFVF